MNNAQSQNQQSISVIPTASDRVLAFEFLGEATADDLEQMAETLNKAFDSQPSVNLLLIFSPFDGAESAGLLNVESLKAQLRSIAAVDKYAVVGAPDYACTMIEWMDSILPVNAEHFAHANIDDAWRFVMDGVST